MNAPQIGQTAWNGLTFYVSRLPDGKSDFGFTKKPEGEKTYVDGEWLYLDRAIPLSPYWQRRFAKRCRDLGDPCKFLPAS